MTRLKQLKPVKKIKTSSTKVSKSSNHKPQLQRLSRSMMVTIRIRLLLNNKRLRKLEAWLVLLILVTIVTILVKIKAITIDISRKSMTQSLQRLKPKKQASPLNQRLKSRCQVWLWLSTEHKFTLMGSRKTGYQKSKKTGLLWLRD